MFQCFWHITTMALNCMICLDGTSHARSALCHRCEKAACYSCLIAYFEANLNAESIFSCPECRAFVWNPHTIRKQFPKRLMEGDVAEKIIKPAIWMQIEAQIPRYQEEAGNAKRIKEIQEEIHRLREIVYDIRERGETFLRNGEIQGVENRDGLNVYDDWGRLTEVHEGPTRDYGVGYDRTWTELDSDERKRTMKILVEQWARHQAAYKMEQRIIELVRLEADLIKKKFDNDSIANQAFRCPEPECRGLVQRETMKCGFCNLDACSRCQQKKEENHVCNEDLVQTLTLIQRETKPCPKCKVSIQKTEGCDQMYCVLCKTVFSWETGLEDRTGIVHNPIAIEVMRNAGVLMRAPGDIPCGGLVTIESWFKFWNKLNEFPEDNVLRQFFNQTKHNPLVSRKRQRDQDVYVEISNYSIAKGVVPVLNRIADIRRWLHRRAQQATNFRRAVMDYLVHDKSKEDILAYAYSMDRETRKLQEDLQIVSTAIHIMVERIQPAYVREIRGVEGWKQWIAEIEGIREMLNTEWRNNSILYNTQRTFAIEADWSDLIVPHY